MGFEVKREFIILPNRIIVKPLKELCNDTPRSKSSTVSSDRTADEVSLARIVFLEPAHPALQAARYSQVQE